MCHLSSDPSGMPLGLDGLRFVCPLPHPRASPLLFSHVVSLLPVASLGLTECGQVLMPAPCRCVSCVCCSRLIVGDVHALGVGGGEGFVLAPFLLLCLPTVLPFPQLSLLQHPEEMCAERGPGNKGQTSWRCRKRP